MSGFVQSIGNTIWKTKTAIFFGGYLGLVTSSAIANDFTAEKVMKEMDGVQRYAYVAGVVEGLAVARYMKDGKKKEGMNCIYDWFYDDKKTVDTIYATFDKYPSYPPGSIMDALSKQRCGE